MGKSNLTKISVKTIFSFFVLTRLGFSQMNSNDFFPLSVGNSWTYNYSTESNDYLNGTSHYSLGTAIYDIQSKILYDDSTIWNFREILDIIEYSSNLLPPQFSDADTVKDTSYFFIVEYNEGNHRLIKIGEENLFTVFPLTVDFHDSAVFFRYYPNVTEDTFSVRTQSLSEPYNKYNISFQRNTGMIKVSFEIEPKLLGFDASSDHNLLNSEITSAGKIYTVGSPINPQLFQNYPNPFNPATKIKYSVPRQSLVSIKVYDIIGKEIQTLVNEETDLGEYEIEFDGSNLSSGVYFYSITAGNFRQVKKMILAK